MRSRFLALVLPLLLASPVAAQGPVVRAILFYSTSCPHCHEVMTQHLPPLIERYGDSLFIAGVNTMTPGGEALFRAVVQYHQLPRQRIGVPLLLVGDEVLVGGLEIPGRFPDIVARGLEAGGVGWPDIPVIRRTLAAQGVPGTEEEVAAEQATDEAAAGPAADSAVADEGDVAETAPEPSTPEAEAETTSEPSADTGRAAAPAEGPADAEAAPSPAASEAEEPVGDEPGEPGFTPGPAAPGGPDTALAADAPPAGVTPARTPGQESSEADREEPGSGGSGMVALGDTASYSGLDAVLARYRRDPVGNTMSVVVLLAMIGLVVFSVRAAVRLEPRLPEWPPWAVPALLVLGFVVAAYLSFVEVSHSEAVCGPVGDCNTVQQSQYAVIAGVPVGVAGLLGYVLLAIAWVVIRGWRSRRAALALWGMALSGTIFSTYLTFLEPFVIGATCLWCLTSAVVMTAIMMAATPLAQAALAGLHERSRDAMRVGT